MRSKHIQGSKERYLLGQTHGSQPTQCPHVQENEAGTITICSYGLEDQTAEHILLRCPLSVDSKNKCVANGSPATHQTLQQQRGTGEDGYIHLVDWTQCSGDREEDEGQKHNRKLSFEPFMCLDLVFRTLAVIFLSDLFSLPLVI